MSDSKKESGTLIKFPFKAAAIDLDGTLLSADKTVSQANLSAIKLLRDHGCQIIMASGRRHEDILPTYHHLGLTGPVISCDGIVIKMPLSGEVLLEKKLHQILAHTLIQEGREHNLSVYYYHSESVFYCQENERTLKYQACTRSRKPIKNEYLHELKGDGAQKIVFCHHPERIAELRASLTERYQDHMQIVESEPGFLEFMPLATSKFTALQELAFKLGFHTDDVLAFGDNWNDVDMLSGVGFGVAMTDSSESAWQAAKAISPAGDSATSFARAVELVFDRFYPSRAILAQAMEQSGQPKLQLV